MLTNGLSVKLRGSHAPLRTTTHSTSPSSPATGAAQELGEPLGSRSALALALASVWTWPWQLPLAWQLPWLWQ